MVANGLKKLSLNLLHFYAHGQLRGPGPSASCANGQSFYIFQAECLRK